MQKFFSFLAMVILGPSALAKDVVLVGNLIFAHYGAITLRGSGFFQQTHAARRTFKGLS
jgi:hypothetical protein